MTLNISKLRIDGGTPLKGQVTVRGAKNLVPKAMVAALLGSTPSVLRNVPDLSDVEVVTILAELHGAKVDYDRETGVLTLTPDHNSQTAERNAKDIQLFGGNSRIPILMVGPLLHTIKPRASPTWRCKSVTDPSTITSTHSVSSAPMLPKTMRAASPWRCPKTGSKALTLN